MEKTLSLKYRPESFSDIVGQPIVVTVLEKMTASGKIFPCFLFSGTRGTGKTSTARIFASVVLPESDQHSLLEIDAASNGSVADMRELRELVRYQTSSGERVVIIDEAHCMSREAFNALLKTLEEPPPNTYFILVTTSPNKIPETILTRSIHLTFKNISSKDIFSRLSYICQQESIEADQEVLKAISKSAKGSLRDAVNSLETAYISGAVGIDRYRELFTSENYSLEILKASCRSDYSLVNSLFKSWASEISNPAEAISLLANALLEVIVCHQQSTKTSEYSELTLLISPKQASFLLGKLWTVFLRGRSPVEIDAIMALSTGLLIEVLGKDPVEEPKEEKISYSEIRSLV